LSDYRVLLAVLVGCFHLIGIISALRALFTARSSQGAVAWVMAMIVVPYVAVPLYWVLGRNRFQGYVDARREGDLEIHAISGALDKYRGEFTSPLQGAETEFSPLEHLASVPFTTSNHAELLVDGQQTFDAIFAAIDQARHYVLVQFFIIHDDELGRQLKARLCAKAWAGVKVLLLYDEVGSHTLPDAYIEELRQAGVDAHPFNTTQGWSNRFQLNFRNHRKIVITDGEVAFVGGLNVGDEYMGRDRRFGPWRDTHARFQGPVATLVQLSFLEDWFWSTRTVPPLVVHCINAAKHRLWIVSPYFVPDDEVVCALQLAVLRGVDVRIMLPLKPDHKMVYLASFSYFPALETLGVKFFRYTPGFLHQKVMLVDDVMASVGTANCDNRSFRLNFEITMAVLDPGFVRAVETMLLRDFANCVQSFAHDYDRRSWLFKAAVKIARLLSPIL